ncbi:hypothetical protein JOC95_003230 [Bacillus tianshenii]|uniref:Uncharacterized protein n=1 Tax=Sutcliffiella tianshenii TaxID=1463404 RepID=A0ABS2P321_9BACI|nr:hypothetical protein [Bacillus tianshenii]
MRCKSYTVTIEVTEALPANKKLLFGSTARRLQTDYI